MRTRAVGGNVVCVAAVSQYGMWPKHGRARNVLPADGNRVRRFDKQTLF